MNSVNCDYVIVDVGSRLSSDIFKYIFYCYSVSQRTMGLIISAKSLMIMVRFSEINST